MSNYVLAAQSLHSMQFDMSPEKLLPWMSEDVTYEVNIAQPEPVKWIFHGKEEVQEYFALLPYTYEIIEKGKRTLLLENNKMILQGSERARLLRSRQIVRTEWYSICEWVDGTIAKITMSVHRWTSLAVV